MIGIADATPLLWILALAAIAVAVRTTLVDRSKAKLLGSVGLRALSIIFISLALTRPSLPAQSQRAHAAFLIDISASVDLASARSAIDEVEAAITKLNPDDGWSIALMGAGLRRVASPATARDLLDEWMRTGGDERFRSQTAIERALELTRLALPADAAGRVVLYTDAKNTGEPLTQITQRLNAESISLVRAPLDGLSEPEAGVVSLEATPANAFEGELVRLRARIVANTVGPAELRLVHRGVVVARRAIETTADAPLDIDITVPMVTPGRSVWTAEIAPQQDFFAINNKASCTVEVSGRPRVLVIHEQPREMRAFERALERQDMVIETRPPRGLPTSLEELLAFDCVVLADAPATAFQAEQLAMLRSFVSDFAGGLAMLGSENSFGLGGYYRTPVEEALPLVSRFEKEKEQPSMAMTLVIDKSGSMSGMPIALARQAAKAATELISARDQIGVVAFDGQAFVATPMQYGSAKEEVKSAIDRIDAGGGTFMYAGMDAARDLLDGAAAQIKHMIVLGDGMTAQADHETLVRDLRSRGVTISTVALGMGADRALLSRLAELGGGRYYETMDPANVPQIFTRETVQASRSAIKEDIYASIKLADHPMLDGVSEGSLPFSLGFVMTRAKPTARVLLATETGEPLLAVNNFGLGATLAFTSDLTPRWGAEWVSWSGFGKFWAQALRTLVRRPDSGDISVSTSADQNELTLDFDSGDRSPASLTPGDLAAWRVERVTKTGTSIPAPVRAQGHTRFAARVPLAQDARTTIRLYNTRTDQLRVIHHQRDYPAEYNLASPNDDALTGLPAFDATKIREGLEPRERRSPLAPWLLVLAAISFIGGTLLRRL